MSLYAIGDIQGCHAEFCQLLELVGFSPESDRLWLVGDLVNRGPESLAVLREVKALGDCAMTVLGNHDFHLLTVAAGHTRPHRHDTIAPILEAPDRDELLGWLQRRPLVVVDGDHLLVHAGLLPAWTPATALALSRRGAGDARERARRRLPARALRRRAARVARRPRGLRPAARRRQRLHAAALLHRRRHAWSSARSAGRRRRPRASGPWFEHEHRASAGRTIVCGHWSTLELRLAPNLLMLDSGCLWGGTLTAVRLEDRRVYQVPGRRPVTPKPFG